MKTWRISCKFCIVQVITDIDDVIIDAPLILKSFEGQPISDLLIWLERKGGQVSFTQVE